MNRCWSVPPRAICAYRPGLSIVNGCATDALASDCISKERESAGRRETLAVHRIEVPEAGKVRISGGGGDFEKPRFASPLQRLAPHTLIPALSTGDSWCADSGWPCSFPCS